MSNFVQLKPDCPCLHAASYSSPSSSCTCARRRAAQDHLIQCPQYPPLLLETCSQHLPSSINIASSAASVVPLLASLASKSPKNWVYIVEYCTLIGIMHQNLLSKQYFGHGTSDSKPVSAATASAAAARLLQCRLYPSSNKIQYHYRLVSREKIAYQFR